jgi:hypothetical protein
MRAKLVAVLAVLAVTAVPAAATLPSPFGEAVDDLAVAASPTATDEATYQAFARVWPDPHGCFVHGDVVPPEAVSPWAKGRVCAADYLSYMDVVEGAKFLERRFPDLVEVIRLDTMYNNPEYRSAGLPRVLATENGDVKPLGRDRSPLYMFKVTDKHSDVPEPERLHFVFSLSIHGLERAGLEGGIRAMEDLVTWAACEQEDERAASTPACDLEGPFPKQIIESDTDRPNPTAGDVLRNTVSYFFLANPDGCKAGQRQPVELRDGNLNANYLPGPSYARGNGNGVDLNRDWPNTGYISKIHQPWSEPETRGFGEVFLDIRDRTADGRFAGGIDLHGMLTASAFSYTLLGADQRDYRKNAITVETSLRTWEDQTARLTWSPYIGDSTGDGVQDRPAAIPVADEWGTIYDTIGYTVTGALGFFMDDSRIGLGGVGINNEMALSNLAPNSIYEPALNQTHIDGNKGLIYSQMAALLYEEEVAFTPGGTVGYVDNPVRITKDEDLRTENPGLPTQSPIDVILPCQGELAQQLPGSCGPGDLVMDGNNVTYEFDVKGPEDGIWNGGMLLTSTRHGQEQGGNVPAVHSNFVVERWGVDHGSDEEGWIIERNFQRSAVSINDPLPGRWRVRYGPATGTAPVRRLAITFDPVTAEASPGQAEVDASSMDFYAELNQFVPEGEELTAVGTETLLAGEDLAALDTLIVTNHLGDAEYLRDVLGLDDGQVAAYFAALRAFAERRQPRPDRRGAAGHRRPRAGGP